MLGAWVRAWPDVCTDGGGPPRSSATRAVRWPQPRPPHPVSVSPSVHWLGCQLRHLGLRWACPVLAPLPPPRAAPFSSEGLTPWGCCLQPLVAPCCLWDQVRESNAAGLGGSALPAPEPPPLTAQALETSMGVSFPLDMPARRLQPALQESPWGRETRFSAPVSLPRQLPRLVHSV